MGGGLTWWRQGAGSSGTGTLHAQANMQDPPEVNHWWGPCLQVRLEATEVAEKLLGPGVLRLVHDLAG